MSDLNNLSEVELQKESIENIVDIIEMADSLSNTNIINKLFEVRTDTLQIVDYICEHEKVNIIDRLIFDPDLTIRIDIEYFLV
jgi:hypothetical protein